MSHLGSLLLTAVILLVATTAVAFVVRPRSSGRPVPVTHQVVGALTVALLALGVSGLLGATPATAGVIAAMLGSSVLLWCRVARFWAVHGLVVWSLTIAVGLLYLAYVLVWTLTTDLSAAGTVASLLLWLLEAFVLLLGVGYVWELVDVLARRVWPAAVDPRTDAPRDPTYPFVSLHVPTHNEPTDMVIETLEQLLKLDYENYEILLVDNNTTDPALWQPVEAFCAQHDRIVFIHLENWPGFKSGALNHALTRTDPRAEVIGIVDADYHVRADFLVDCAPLFADPAVSFVQTPQDYRDWEGSSYFRRLYHSYSYFFDVSQKSRNERNGAIFGGTMGLIRRSGLEQAGGWDEWCITEDAELSLRLLRSGGTGVHIDRSYGRGVMPLTFEALKRQRFRWCFGGVQLLRMHWRDLLPGRRTERNQLTLGQRWAYLVGGLQWFGDLASMLFTGFLLLGALDAIVGSGLVIRRLSGVLLVSVVVVVVLGALRSVALVHRTSGARWRESFGAFGLWLALGWTVAQAASRGLFAREGVFLRTPKVRGELGVRHALRGNLAELLLAAVCGAVALVALTRGSVGPVVVGGLLLIQAIGYAAAPLNSVAAIRADLPEELRRRRLASLQSWGTPARRGGVLVGLTAAAALAVVGLAAPLGGPLVTPGVAEPREGTLFEPAPDADAGDGEAPDMSETQPGGSSATSSSPTPGAPATTGQPAAPGTTAPAGTGPTSPPPGAGQPTEPVATTPPAQQPTTPAPQPTTPPAPTQQPTAPPGQGEPPTDPGGAAPTTPGARP